MKQLKCLSISFVIFCGLTSCSHNKDGVFMKWKLNQGQVISYGATLDEADTAIQKDISFNDFSKSGVGDPAAIQIKNFYKGLNLDVQHQKFVVRLSEKRNNIDVKMRLLKKEATDLKSDTSRDGVSQLQSLFSRTSGDVMLRGSINEDGMIESFYTVNSQKNLLAMFFELPGKTVAVGDSWPLDIHLISMDQSFVCDSSYRRNLVKVAGIENKQGETIVTLYYDILEFVKGHMNSPFDDSPTKTTVTTIYRAVATFSVEKGRWLTYEGVMVDSKEGLMSSHTTQKYSLVAE